MSDFLKLLTTEVDIKLIDERNDALSDLLSNSYRIYNSQVSFKIKDVFFGDGIATIATPGSPDLNLLVNVYILKETIYVALFTLDLVKFLDVPYPVFIAELGILMSK